jgi:TRAP-type C4-dicarboxylate transport system permease small subunit
MSDAAGPPLALLSPGLPFLLLLAGLAGAGLLLHAWARRRIGASRLDLWIRRLEQAVFTLFLTAMLALSLLQVVLRNVLHEGLLWIDPLVRTLVLWVAFFGALTATSQARHLHVDVMARVLPERVAARIGRLLAIVSAACSALLANAAFVYLRDEYQFGTSPFLGIPSWAAQSVMLFGFAALAYRFLVQAIWPAPRPRSA